MLLLWGMSFALLFIPQQQRLLIIAPEYAAVLLALNNSALYWGSLAVLLWVVWPCAGSLLPNWPL